MAPPGRGTCILPYGWGYEVNRDRPSELRISKIATPGQKCSSVRTQGFKFTLLNVAYSLPAVPAPCSCQTETVRGQGKGEGCLGLNPSLATSLLCVPGQIT